MEEGDGQAEGERRASGGRAVVARRAFCDSLLTGYASVSSEKCGNAPKLNHSLH